MNSWLISVRSDKYDFDSAFFELKNNSIDQYQKLNGYEIGDFVYIYCAPDQEIKYKCKITKVNIPASETINDEKYMIDKDFFKEKKHDKNMRLQLVGNPRVGINKIQEIENGIKFNLQQEMSKKLLQYLNNLSADVDNDNIFEIDPAIKNDSTIDNTEKLQLSYARKGQGLFRTKVINIDKKCQITDVDDLILLIASHILAWKDSDNYQRLDGNNGILLSPHLDKLFDKHLISFDDDGKMVTYNEYTKEILHQWGIDTGKKYFDFSNERKEYLKKHREICEELN